MRPNLSTWCHKWPLQIHDWASLFMFLQDLNLRISCITKLIISMQGRLNYKWWTLRYKINHLKWREGEGEIVSSCPILTLCIHLLFWFELSNSILMHSSNLLVGIVWFQLDPIIQSFDWKCQIPTKIIHWEFFSSDKWHPSSGSWLTPTQDLLEGGA